MIKSSSSSAACPVSLCSMVEYCCVVYDIHSGVWHVNASACVRSCAVPVMFVLSFVCANIEQMQIGAFALARATDCGTWLSSISRRARDVAPADR